MLRQRYVQSLIFTKDFYFHIYLQKNFVGADGDAYFLVTLLDLSSPSSLLFSREANYKLIETDHTCLLVYLIAMSETFKLSQIRNYETFKSLLFHDDKNIHSQRYIPKY